MLSGTSLVTERGDRSSLTKTLAPAVRVAKSAFAHTDATERIGSRERPPGRKESWRTAAEESGGGRMREERFAAK